MLKAVLVEIPPVVREWMDERARVGNDRHDEMWDGVQHVVPPPSFGHQHRGTGLLTVFATLAAGSGLLATYETGVFRPGTSKDYRIPDLVVVHPDHVSERGVEGRAELVVELRSPDDESWEKLPFYAEMGVQEVLIVDATACAVFRLDPETGGFTPSTAGPDGFADLACLPVAVMVNPAGHLLVRTADGIRVL